MRSSLRKRTFAAPLVAVALALLAGSAGAGDLMSGDPQTMGKWYGRAGGLAGSDRVTDLGQGTGGQVAMAADEGVRQRTNMSAAGAMESNRFMTITPDQGVVDRTNMNSQSSAQTVQAAAENR